MAQHSIPASSTRREQLTIGIPRTFPPMHRQSEGAPQYLNYFEEHVNHRKLPRPSVASEKQIKFLPPFLSLLISSRYCLVVLCIILIVPILEFAIGLAFKNQCPANSLIPIYLIVSGAGGITAIGLAILILASFICCVKQDSIAGSCISGCMIGIIIFVIILVCIFLFAWFIAGNVWVFGAQNIVDFVNEKSPNYCHSTLYNFAFWIIIITYVLTVISCCLSCCHACTRSVTTLRA